MNVPMPNVVTKIATPVNGLHFEIVAYRTVTKEEALHAIAAYFQQQKKAKRKKAAPGSTIKVLTLHGAVG